jgi:hypothetical protein
MILEYFDGVDWIGVRPSNVVYPNDLSLFLRGDGNWSNRLEKNGPLNFTLNSTDVTSTHTAFVVEDNGVVSASFGYNNSTNTAFVKALSGSTLLLVSNDVGRLQIGLNGDFDFKNNFLTNVKDPVNDQDVATKHFLDQYSISLFGAVTGTGKLNAPIQMSLAPVPASGISGFPNNTVSFLRADGVWTNTLVANGSLNYILNNTDITSTETDLYIQKNGAVAATFGYNNAADEAYIFAYGAASFKLYTNAVNRLQVLSNGNFDFKSNRLTNVPDPISAQEPITKNYLDTTGYGTYGSLYINNNATTTTLVANVWTKIAGTTTLGNSSKVTSPQDNRLRYIGSPPINALVTANVSVLHNISIGATYGVSIFKNGVQVLVPAFQNQTITGALTGLNIAVDVPLLESDYLEVYLNSTFASSIAVKYMNFTVQVL